MLLYLQHVQNGATFLQINCVKIFKEKNRIPLVILHYAKLRSGNGIIHLFMQRLKLSVPSCVFAHDTQHRFPPKSSLSPPSL